MTKVVVDGIDLADLLGHCQNPSTRAEAEKRLEVLQTSHPYELFPGLAMILANDSIPPVARQLAGLVLKNSFAGAKDGARDKQCKERWMALSQAGEPGRLIKQGIVSTLTTSSDVVARRTAAQVISAIAVIELPQGQWLDLVDPILVTAFTKATDVLSKASVLICLAYISEELTSRELTIPQPSINAILTAIVQGMQDRDDLVKKEATKAMYFAIVLAKSNFQNEPERDVLVQAITDCVKLGTIVGATRAQIDVCAAGCECLVQIATSYYEHLTKYMNVIGPLTFELMKQKQNDHLCMCAIEFWSTVCDEENYIRECLQFGEECNALLGLSEQAMSYLVPILTEVMAGSSSTDDDDEEEEWDSAMAAGTCLALLAQAVGDKLVDSVIQFVNSNYNSPNPKLREASMLAYGSLMDGPSSTRLTPIIQMSLSVIVDSLNDPTSAAVRDNAAWTIGRICQFHTEAIAPALPNLIPILLTRLASDKPRVAANVAWTFDILGQEQESVPNLISGAYFTQIVGGLLSACVRPDAHVRNLRMTGYAAVSSLASHVTRDSGESLKALLDEMCVRLESSLASANNDNLSQADRDCELQGHICGCMQVVVSRLKCLGTCDLTDRAERIMTLYMRVFQLYQYMQNSSTAIHEETLLATAALASSLGPRFKVFMPTFFPILQAALAHCEAFAVCSMAIGIVGDLSRALDSDIAPYCEPLMRVSLAPMLEQKSVDRRLKPLVMTTIGDLALATRAQFEPFVAGSMKLLAQAGATRLEDGPVDSEEWIDYLNQLRASVLDAYTGIVHGLRECKRHAILTDQVQSILQFVVRLIEDKSVSEDVVGAAMGLVGDLVISFQADLARMIRDAPFMQRLVSFAATSKDPKTQATGEWLARTVDKYGP